MLLSHFKQILLLQRVALTITTTFVCVTWAQNLGDKRRNSEVELTVSAHNEKIKPGAPLHISVVLKNVSKSPVVVQVSCLELNYTFVVLRENGDSVPMTAEGKRRNNVEPSACRRKTLLVQSENTLQVDVDAALLYEFTKAGHYSILVKREYRTADGIWHRAESAPLYVTIE
jgi:hypothetical protein